jgi:hypothetical protein
VERSFPKSFAAAVKTDFNRTVRVKMYQGGGRGRGWGGGGHGGGGWDGGSHGWGGGSRDKGVD